VDDQNYYQFAYVTTDWERAKAELAAQHGIGNWYEMADAEFDTGENRTAVCHFALAFKSGLQFEIIQPRSGDDSVYREGLPESGYAKRFHHLGRHFGDRGAFERQLDVAKSRYPMPVAWDTMGGTYAYFDARDETGHFLEYFCFPPDSHLASVPRF
jgi:Glyoxalase/Bleomycin resistance protein/Dioxygenase superfamily